MPEAQGRVTIWGIEVFVAVAEEGSITAAARRLGVSPPAVSQQLAATEAIVGASLFDRAARPFALTPAGQIFRPHAQSILNSEAEARASLAQADLSRLPALRIGMIEDFDAEVTPSLLSALAKGMANTRFLLETGPSHRLLDQLESRALDVVVSAELEGAGADPGWREVRAVMTDPFVMIRPKLAPEPGGELPFIMYSSRHLMGRQIAGHLARQNLRYPTRFELDSYNAILALVAQGVGWTILTPLALHHAGRFLDHLTVTPLEGEPLSRKITLSSRAGVLGELPGQILSALRPAVAGHVIAPTVARWPWLADRMPQV